MKKQNTTFSNKHGLAFIFAFSTLILILSTSNRMFAQYCKGDTVSFDAGSGYTGNIQWQESVGGFFFIDIAGATSNPYSHELVEDRYYRGMISSGTCDPVYTDTIHIVISNTKLIEQSTSVDFATNTRSGVDTAGNQVLLSYSGSYPTGTGADGAFNTTSSVTTLAGGVYNYTSFTINSGHTVNVTGTTPLEIFATGAVTIDGTLNLSGADGADGDNNLPPGIGGAGGGGGGFAGGVGGDGNPPITSLTYHGEDGTGPGFGIGGITEYTATNDGQGGGGGAFGTTGGNSNHSGGGGGIGGTPYGSAMLTTLQGGSGGAGGAGDDDGGGGNSDGGGGGGGGGGAVKISAGSLTIGNNGEILAEGGDGGSCGNGGSGGGGAGGAIHLVSFVIDNNGIISADGGISTTDQLTASKGGDGGDGRIRLDYIGLNGASNISPNAGYTSTPGSVAFGSSGTMTTAALSPVDLCVWGEFKVHYDTSATGTSIKIDVLDGVTSAVLASNITHNTDLSTIPAVANTAQIKFRFQFTSTVTSSSPFLQDWSVEYFTK